LINDFSFYSYSEKRSNRVSEPSLLNGTEPTDEGDSVFHLTSDQIKHNRTTLWC